MSDALYLTRLTWNHHRGLARFDGVQVELHHPPRISGLAEMTELEFIPNIVATVRIGCDATRDLSHDETHDALALLQRMAHAARTGLDQPWN